MAKAVIRLSVLVFLVVSASLLLLFSPFSSSLSPSLPLFSLRLSRSPPGTPAPEIPEDVIIPVAGGIWAKNEIVFNSALANQTVREALGRSTWTLLHTMAARYPETPSEEQKQKTNDYIIMTSQLYPCGQCAKHFQDLLETNPPKLETQDEFIYWLCDIHNTVNLQLGKPQFDCSTVKSRWTCGCVDEV